MYIHAILVHVGPTVEPMMVELCLLVLCCPPGLEDAFNMFTATELLLHKRSVT